MKSNLVAVASLNNAFEAHLVKALLEDHDMAVYVLDEQILNVLPSLSPMTGGVKVCVRADDVARAMEIIESQPEIGLSE